MSASAKAVGAAATSGARRVMLKGQWDGYRRIEVKLAGKTRVDEFNGQYTLRPAQGRELKVGDPIQFAGQWGEWREYQGTVTAISVDGKKVGEGEAISANGQYNLDPIFPK